MTFFSFLNNFLTWWGAILLGALDSSLFVFVPFGNDAVVIYLCARDPSLFWLYPLLVTAGSVVGGAGTYLIGVKIGDAGGVTATARSWLNGETSPATDALFAPFGGPDEGGRDEIAQTLIARGAYAELLWNSALVTASRRRG